MNVKAKILCKGCGIKKGIPSLCYFQIVHEQKKCPCVSCLVKVTCNLTIFCETRAEAMHRLITMREANNCG